MVTIQIQLAEEQVRDLRELSALEGTSMSDLIRRSVDAFLESRKRESRKEMKRRAIEAVGRFRSGVSDLADEHDYYLSLAADRQAKPDLQVPEARFIRRCS